jgi:hypothetical protein
MLLQHDRHRHARQHVLRIMRAQRYCDRFDAKSGCAAQIRRLSSDKRPAISVTAASSPSKALKEVACAIQRDHL